MIIAISSGHGLHVSGAHTALANEVIEARRVTQDVVRRLRELGVWAFEFHDDSSRNQNDNLNAIVRWHNERIRTLDVSIHFNAIDGIRPGGIGVEVLHRTPEAADLARRVSAAIASAGQLINRGAVNDGRANVRFLNQAQRPAILIEVGFINSETDMRNYRRNYDEIVNAIARTLAN